jgi:hypothetical protein
MDLLDADQEKSDDIPASIEVVVVFSSLLLLEKGSSRAVGWCTNKRRR